MKKKLPSEPDISDNDLYEAMKDIEGYLDITPADLGELYRHAYRHAVKRITNSLRAKDIMTTDVFSVKRDTPLREVAGIMGREGISGVPVVDDTGSVVGIISEKDFLSRMGGTDRSHFMRVIATCLQGGVCLAGPIRAKTAEEIMTSPAAVVTPQTTVYEIADLFSAKKINRAPVVAPDGTLIGIVSRADIISAVHIKDAKG